MGAQVVGSGREQAQNKTWGAESAVSGGLGKEKIFRSPAGRGRGRESTKYLAEHNPEHCAFVPKEATTASNRASNH